MNRVNVNEQKHIPVIVPYSNEMNEYLLADEIVDYENEAILQLSDMLYQKANDELAYIKLVYEYVKDTIGYSADISKDAVTCSATEVLHEGHGFCFAKSHLLAALLRCKSIPTGFCYQKIILNEETTPILAYHGLNGVHIKRERWMTSWYIQNLIKMWWSVCRCVKQKRSY